MRKVRSLPASSMSVIACGSSPPPSSTGTLGPPHAVEVTLEKDHRRDAVDRRAPLLAPHASLDEGPFGGGGREPLVHHLDWQPRSFSDSSREAFGGGSLRSARTIEPKGQADDDALGRVACGRGGDAVRQCVRWCRRQGRQRRGYRPGRVADGEADLLGPG